MKKDILNGLLKIKAIKLNFTTPFIWTSGINSPIYCDNRRTIGDYQLRTQIAAELTSIIKKDYPEVNLIGACATAGIPHGTSVADNLQLPMVYFRSKPKGHGTNSITEGKFSKGQKVVIIEDLISTASSVKKAIIECNSIGLEVLGVVSIVNYGLPKAKKNLTELNISYRSILSYNDFKEYLEISNEEKNKLEQFFNEPTNNNIWD